MTLTGGPDTSETQSKVEDIFNEVFDLPASERTAVIERLAGGHESLIKQVESKVRTHDDSEKFFEKVFALQPITIEDDDLSDHQVGAYRLIRPLAPGGMGDVYLAERCDDQYEQQVAIKLVHDTSGMDGGHEWFARERKMLAMLEHPCIARLLDAGIYRHRPYVVLEYVEGESIDNYCHDNELSINDRLRLFLSVLETVHFAHQRTVTHRDLKPQNILITGDGMVKIVDFGIGDILSNDSPDLQQKFGPRLTPDYAAPEQWSGTARATTVDLYSLGVVLFKLLSGRKPYTRDQINEFSETNVWPDQPPTMSKALMQSPRPEHLALRRGLPVEQLQRLLGGELQAIVSKAMMSAAGERYGSASQFAQDIRRYLDGRPVEAVGDHRGYVARKWIKRNPWPVAAASLTLAFLCGALVYQKHVADNEAAMSRAVAYEREQAVTLSRLLFDVFESASPTRTDGNSITVREAINANARNVLLELASDRDLAARFAAAVGVMLSDLQSFEDAEYFLHESRRALDELATQRTLTRDEREIQARTMLALASSYEGLAQYDDALALLEPAREAVLNWSVDANDMLLQLLNTKTTILSGLNDVEGERSAALEAADFARQQPDARAATRALALNNLAVSQNRNSAMSDVIKTLDDARSVLSTLPDHHPLRATVLANLGGAFFQSGNRARAEALYLEVIESQRTSNMDETLTHAQAEYGLGIINLMDGQYAQALPHLQRASGLHRMLKRSADGDSWRVDFALATAQHGLGQLAAARSGYEALVQTSTGTLNNPNLLGRVQLRMAAIAVDEGRYASAQELLARPETIAMTEGRRSAQLFHQAAHTISAGVDGDTISVLGALHETLLEEAGPHSLPTRKVGEWHVSLAAARTSP